MARDRKALSFTIVCNLIGLPLMGWLVVQPLTQFKLLHSPPVRMQQSTEFRATELRVVLNVSNVVLPVTVGVPIGEAANVTDTSALAITDAMGNVVPSQLKVLARWGAPVNQTAKPIKWLLADFKPTVSGTHFLVRVLTQQAQSTSSPVVVTETGSAVRLKNAQLEIEFARLGDALVKSFKLGGSEMLRAPMMAQMSLPRRVVLNRIGASPDEVMVTDTTLLRSGDEARFEHVSLLQWDATAGSARLVTGDQSLTSGRRYRIGEGASQEDVFVSSASPGDLKSDTPLRFDHPAGATIRDLSIEQERATIKTTNGQTVRFNAPLAIGHLPGEKLIVIGGRDEIATATIEKTTIEESNSLRVVIRQDGVFKINGTTVPPKLAFTVRYYVYADQPFVRVRWRMMNNGAYGFGAYRGGPSPYPQQVLLRSLSVLMPTASASDNSVQVLNSNDAHRRLAAGQSGASLVAGQFEIAVPEFVENYPKTLTGNRDGFRFDVLPDTAEDHTFDGARAKTTDFYLGRNTIAARALTNSQTVTLDPAYIASTAAVRAAFIERRNWQTTFEKELHLPNLIEAANRMERMLAVGYSVEAAESAGSVPAQSAFEYRMRSEQGEQFGWRNFGDMAWGDGYANLHYDLPFVLLREYLRTVDARAFKLGSEMARYRADWGQFRADDFLNSNWNLRGMAFYEKGDHGSFREPAPSHTWVEGMWLFWAMTGDEAVHESAIEGSESLARMDFNYGNALSWNESRWVGWPTLGLMVAWRYTGEVRYLNKARDNVYLLVQTEENFGRKGFYANRSNSQPNIQPWMWAGYSQLGAIDYWRETGDARVAQYLVRVADWIISKGSENPPLKPSQMLRDGSYLPAGMSYFWDQDKVFEDRSLALAGLSLPVLTAAARISGRDDLRQTARQLFRDYALYRDLPDGKAVLPSTRAVINFRSLQFAASSPKVYGQMGLILSDVLPELADSIVVPKTLLAPAPVREAPQFPSTPSATLTNVAMNRPATASSTRVWPGTIGVPAAANDNQASVAGKNSIWHSESNTGKTEWWQVDLGRAYRIELIEIQFRADQDQPLNRQNFEVRASNDAAFGNFVTLAAQGDSPIPFGQNWKASPTEPGSYRFVRVQKTRVDRDQSGNSYFTLAEVQLMAASTTAPPSNPPGTLTYPLTTLAQLKAQRLLVGQSLSFALPMKDFLTAYNLPENSNFDLNTGKFWFTPTSAQAGEVYQISFQTRKSGGMVSMTRLDVTVVMDGAPTVRLISPNFSTRLTIGQSALVAWSVPQSAPITKYQVRLSTDGGASYPSVISEVPGSATQFQWTVPNSIPTGNRSFVRLLVKAIDANNRIGVDYSRQDLRVTMGSPQR